MLGLVVNDADVEDDEVFDIMRKSFLIPFLLKPILPSLLSGLVADETAGSRLDGGHHLLALCTSWLSFLAARRLNSPLHKDSTLNYDVLPGSDFGNTG